MTLILEIGMWFFIITLFVCIAIAILTLVGAIVEAYQEGETVGLIFAVLGTLLLISILLMFIGALTIALF